MWGGGNHYTDQLLYPIPIAKWTPCQNWPQLGIKFSSLACLCHLPQHPGCTCSPIPLSHLRNSEVHNVRHDVQGKKGQGPWAARLQLVVAAWARCIGQVDMTRLRPENIPTTSHWLWAVKPQNCCTSAHELNPQSWTYKGTVFASQTP